MKDSGIKSALAHVLRALLIVPLFIIILLVSPHPALADEEETELPDNGIPVVYLEIDETQGSIADMIASVNHSVYCYGTVRIEVPEGFHYSDFPDLPCESTGQLTMSIRGRGNSSWRQADKKPFKIKLDKKADLFGLGKNKHWALLANAFDPSLLRNRVTAWLGEQMDFEFTPRGVPVDLVMIGQEYGTRYLGSYYLAENVRVDTNRLEIEELEETDVEEPTITGGYLLQNALQVRAGSPDRFYTSRGVDWATDTPSFDTEEDIAPPEDEDDEKHGPLGENVMELPDELGDAYENPAQQQYIQRHIQIVEDALFAEDTSYLELMDIESAAKYWLVNEFTKNNDAFATGSTYIYKRRDADGVVSKIYWGPLWDFDFAYDRNFTVDDFSAGHLWIQALFCHREEGGLRDEILKQWPVMKAAAEELLQDGGIIDQYYAETLASAEKDLQINHADEDLTYKEYVDNMKQWITDRVAWMDAHIGEIDDLVHKIRYIVDDELWDSELVEHNQEAKLVRQRPEKDGFVFLGWADEDGQPVESEFRPARDTILTAQYISEDEAILAQDIVFRKASDIIRPGYVRAYTIDYRIIPTNAQDQMIQWTSSNEAFATIDEFGMVKYNALDEGTTSVTVTFTGTLRSGLSRDFTLTILQGSLPAAETIVPVEDKIMLDIGEQHGFVITTDPDPAVIDSYEYSSADESIATIDESGVITAVGYGKTIVKLSATVSQGGEETVLEAKIKVTVAGEPIPMDDSSSDPNPTESIESAEPEASTEDAGPALLGQQSESSDAVDPSAAPAPADHRWLYLGGAAVLIAAGIILWRILAARKNR